MKFYDDDPDPAVEEGYSVVQTRGATEVDCAYLLTAGQGKYLATRDSIRIDPRHGNAQISDAEWIEPNERFQTDWAVYVKDHECDELKPVDCEQRSQGPVSTSSPLRTAGGSRILRSWPGESR